MLTMTKWRLKCNPIEAVHWIGQDLPPEWQPQIHRATAAHPDPGRLLRVEFRCPVKGWKVVALPGDFLVKLSDGSIERRKADSFLNDFEPMPFRHIEVSGVDPTAS